MLKRRCMINYFEMGTKFSPPYACIFMDMVENEFLEQQEIKPWVWLRYIDDIFFVLLEGEDKLFQFLNRLNAFHPGLKFTYEYSQTKVNFLDVSVGIDAGRFITILFCKPTDCYQYLHYESSHPRTLKDLSYIVRVCASRKFARVKRILRNTYRNYIVGLKIEHIQHGSQRENLRGSRNTILKRQVIHLKKKVVRQECL
jgi:hypothetical protein